MRRILISVSLVVAMGVVAVGATGAFFSDTETSTGNTIAAGSIDLRVDNTSYLNGVFNPKTSWLLTDLTNELFFDFDDLKPGDFGEDTISLHVDNNDSYLCVDVTLTSDDDNGLTEPEEGDGDTTGGVSEGELADEVDFIWWADDGDNVLETDEELLPAGPLGFLDVGETATVALADSMTNIWDESGPIPGESTRFIGKAWCFGEIVIGKVTQDNEGLLGDPSTGGTNGPDARGAGFVCDASGLDNTTQSDSLTADIAFSAVQARHNDTFKCSDEGGIGCSEKADVMMVLDSSGSISTAELEVATTSARAFIEALAPSTDGVHVGLVDFDSSATLLKHLTDDGSAVIDSLDLLVSGGSTELDDGIDVAATELENPDDGHDRPDGVSPDFIVIITDGAPSSETAAEASADAAKAAGATIFVVGVGTDSDTADFLRDDIATSPSHYFDAADFDDLEAILDGLATCDA